MVLLRKSPFKVDKIEDDPHAFGNRPKEVIACVGALINNRHVLISGPRGIGKSSLAYQIHNLYKGDHTLAARCKIETKLDNFLTCFYTCDSNTDLASLALDLIFRLENKCLWVKSVRTAAKKKFETSINLGVFKVNLGMDLITSKPASIATQLINALNCVYKSIMDFTDYKGINILIDEIDQISDTINFGHFLKIIHEYLLQDGLANVNFIFAGQKGVYSRLYTQDPSIERIVRHVPISKLDADESRYILDYASSKKADPSFIIAPKAGELILKMSSGFPYVIQLLGDAAFSSMNSQTRMTHKDVLEGIDKILRLDKNEKYYSILNALTSDERKILTMISNYKSSELPVSVPKDWIIEEGKNFFKQKEKITPIIKSLSKSGHLIVNEENGICQFNDELFRIFIALIYSEAKEQLYQRDKVEFISISDPKIKKIVDQIESAKYRRVWEVEEEGSEEII